VNLQRNATQRLFEPQNAEVRRVCIKDMASESVVGVKYWMSSLPSITQAFATPEENIAVTGMKAILYGIPQEGGIYGPGVVCSLNTHILAKPHQ
jgi:hypothetical protein